MSARIDRRHPAWVAAFSQYMNLALGHPYGDAIIPASANFADAAMREIMARDEAEGQADPLVAGLERIANGSTCFCSATVDECYPCIARKALQGLLPDPPKEAK